MKTDKDTMERHLNDFAQRSFRDMADRDYIAARLACRANLIPQFLWSAQQAIEKYLKYIFLVNRIPAMVGHDINAALTLTQQLPFKIEIRNRGEKFIKNIATYGQYRYLDVSYFVDGYLLVDLDVAIWDLRRYCQVLHVFDGKLSAVEQKMFEDARAMLEKSGERSPHEFFLSGGFLEEVLAKKDHPARSALVWQNAFYGVRARKKIKVQEHFQAANSPLYLYPEMLDELLKYVFIPKPLQAGYREHLRRVLADPSKRP